jgi:hypothetical protein
VASSCFPLYLPHTAGTTHPWSAHRLIGSTQRLLTGGQDGAYLELTTLPSTHTPPFADTDGVGHQGKDR